MELTKCTLTFRTPLKHLNVFMIFLLMYAFNGKLVDIIYDNYFRELLRIIYQRIIAYNIFENYCREYIREYFIHI